MHLAAPPKISRTPAVQCTKPLSSSNNHKAWIFVKLPAAAILWDFAGMLQSMRMQLPEDDIFWKSMDVSRGGHQMPSIQSRMLAASLRWHQQCKDFCSVSSQNVCECLDACRDEFVSWPMAIGSVVLLAWQVPAAGLNVQSRRGCLYA